MDDQINKEILKELRKQTQYNIYVIIVVMVFFIISVGGRYFFESKKVTEPCKASQTWNDVSHAMKECDYEKALSIAKNLTEKSPKYWYGYSYLGNIYTALGDIKKAETNYSKAYEMFPIKENKENLDAIRKVLNKP